MQRDEVGGTRIRQATRQDVDQIVRLTNAGGPDGKPRIDLPDQLPDGYFRAFDSIAQDPKQLLMVADLDDRVIGTFHMTFLSYLAAAGKEDCLIEAVHVARSHRGKGLGTDMMNWAISRARERGCRRVQLTTDKKRVEAHRFYERLGFVISHEGAKLGL